jgi:signal transduction histidine kinase
LSLDEQGPTPDLYLWDVTDVQELPLDRDITPSRYLFLVHRSHVNEFRNRLGWGEANILLKPVTRSTLAAFLALAISAHEERVAAANELRTDRDEILQSLITANLRLQEFDYDRTNFLARALHDFRAPLTAIHGYCGLLLNQVPGPLNNEQAEVLRRMQHSTKRLSRMTFDMFQLSVGRHVQKVLKISESDLRECIEQALHEVGPQAESKKLTISVDLDPEPPAMYFEADSIEQVLVNILDNACKFAPRSGRIRIQGYPYFWERRSQRAGAIGDVDRRNRSSSAANTYRIDISDSGAPIPDSRLADIFEEYISYAGGHDRSGGGLGLAICRMIVSQHGGHIWAENRDSGPLFSFVLPLRPQQQTVNKQADQYGGVTAVQL